MNLRRLVEPLIRPMYRAYSRRTRGMTLGVRGLVIDGEGRVLLVEHTYTPGWYMPGGGVERGETVEESLHRELMEEAGVRMTGRPRLLSMHSNDASFRGDHVLIYRVTAWEECECTQTGEIAQRRWFALEELPDAVTPATRRRIAEALEGAEAHPHW